MLLLQGPRQRLFVGCNARAGRRLLAPGRFYSGNIAPAQARSMAGTKGSPGGGAARTRFAPSPTGYLHMGSLRTALFNYLLAQSTGGQFLLRLEDTDRTRIVPDAEKRLYEDLEWAGLHWDEGPDIGGPKGPYRQSERLHIYREYAHQLLSKGRAYRCFCSKDELAASQLGSQADLGHTGRYPGTCLAVTPDESEERAANGEAHVIRFKSSSEPVSVPDIVYRGFRKRQAEDDFIIIKSDGFPTYHFANVVDDHLMDVTHVIRGAEWLVSTPMHCDLYAALGWKQPVFAHVGLLVNADRQKLSKRNSDIQISSYQDKNILPEALVNFVASLGWRAPSKKGVLTLPQLVECFDLRFTKGDIVTELEKLQFYQRKHLDRLLVEETADPESCRSLDPILRSVVRDIRSLETGRSGATTSLESLPCPGPFDMPSIGEIHPDVKRDLEDEGRRQYVLAALRLLKNKAWPLEGLVADNRYIFWRPSRSRLLDTLDQLKGAVGDVAVDGSAGGVRDALVSARQALGSLAEGAWTDDRLGDAIASVNASVSCRDRETGEPLAHAAFKLWRWVLAALDPGPPVHSLLGLLGRQETITRLDLAIEILGQEGSS